MLTRPLAAEHALGAGGLVPGADQSASRGAACTSLAPVVPNYSVHSPLPETGVGGGGYDGERDCERI